ncbi:MAG TPA: PilZ domain-containing protein [Allosphingosinicella sp.]|nr:PilZ domain-containing protein [Allosphingosinicella sp.]
MSVVEGSEAGAAEPPCKLDRRRDIRHLTILRVGTLVVDGRRELCLVRNISAGGLMAMVCSPFEADQHIAIELRPDQPIAGTVTWARDSTIGVAFDGKVDIAEALSNSGMLDNGWRPRMPRVPVDWMATLRAGARTYWVSTRDISQGGVKVETDQPLDIGGETMVTLENFRPIPGVVRWHKENVAGISFNQIIPFHELGRWLSERGKD